MPHIINSSLVKVQRNWLIWRSMCGSQLSGVAVFLSPQVNVTLNEPATLNLSYMARFTSSCLLGWGS